MRLRGSCNAFAFCYFLCVRREDRARFFLGSEVEGYVFESSIEAPLAEVSGSVGNCIGRERASAATFKTPGMWEEEMVKVEG